MGVSLTRELSVMIEINYLHLLFSRLRNAVMDSGARTVNVGCCVFNTYVGDVSFV